MRHVFRLVLLALLMAQPVQAVTAPKLMVVYFHADWCPNCPAVKAAIEEVKHDGVLAANGVQFVTLDLTNKTRIHTAFVQAKALGIYDYLKQRGSAVGYVGVLNLADMAELTRFYRDDTAEEIRAALSGYLAQ